MSAVPAAPVWSGEAGSEPAGVLRALANALASLACILPFCLSGNLLFMMGIPYGIESGPAFTKIHPGTWLAFLAVGLHGLRAGNPVNYIAVMGWRFPGSAVFLVLLAAVMAYNGLLPGANLSVYIDTFAVPALMLWLLSDLREFEKRRLRLFLHVFMAVNAALGLYEMKSGFRFTPFLIGDSEAIEWDWRSTALLGHPLSNAVTVAMYILALALERSQPLWLRFTLIAFQLVAMSAFGARAATGMVLLALGLLIALHILRIFAGARVSLAGAAATFAGLPLVAGAAVIVFQSGLFDKFIDRLSDDAGSSKVRVLMFGLFKGMSWDAFLFGSNMQYIRTQQYLNGFELGIESFWLASIIQQGLVISLVLWSGMFLFFSDLVRETGPRAIWLVCLAIAVASTSTSLAGKGPMLTFLVCFVVLLLQDPKKMRKA
ncbi:MAG: hypothetical protein JWM36_2785 [Hyphomicrobiales bacterium]|nr:hypothetical protein [Hyphomicrobiales bacterium]